MTILQNIIMITGGYLLSQVMIAAKIHRRLSHHLLAASSGKFSFLLGTVLFLSFFLSMFFSNTVVVLVLLPLAQRLTGLFAHAEENRRSAATLLYCALIFGAHSGGMASLTGNPMNIVAVSIAEINNLEGSEKITFSSWLMAGFPAALLLATAGFFILKQLLARESLQLSVPPSPSAYGYCLKRPVMFFGGNILVILLLSLFEFLAEPAPVAGPLNMVDIAYILWLSTIVFSLFISPRKPPFTRNTIINIWFLLLTIITFPLFALLLTLQQLRQRTGFGCIGLEHALSARAHEIFGRFWSRHCTRHPATIWAPNPYARLSLHLMARNIPFTGLLLMVGAALLLAAVGSIGDDPLTPEHEGILHQVLLSPVTRFIDSGIPRFLSLFFIALITVFATELLSNATVVLLLLPIMLSSAATAALDPLSMLLLLTITSSTAFMSPFSSPVTALAFGGFDHISLKKVLIAGLLLNMIATVWITLLFSLPRLL
ncbi:MAG: SLC13 family permease [Prosthecochloris sp.]|nr:SLC13 family permease [Prosthecochloris sp.]